MSEHSAPLVEVSTTLAPAWVDTENASRYTSIPASTLETMRNRGGGPVFRKLGRAVRYRVADLDRYMESQPVGGVR